MLIMRQRGFTLIELIITITIISILLVMGVPTFNLWIQNTQNRTAAESVLNGLQLARNEAVVRNTRVRFDLTQADGQVAWNVGCVTVTPTCPASIQRRPAGEGGANARAGISTVAIPVPTPVGHFGAAIAAGTDLPAGVSFDGLGRVPDASLGTEITRIDITSNAIADARRYVVVIGMGGQIRMCDPAQVFADNPQGCS